MAAPKSSSSSISEYLEEDKFISEQCKQLMLTLPKEKGWVIGHIYEYQGVWLAPILLQGVVNSQAHFQALPTDVILAANPKCGTTWLKAIIFSLLNRGTHPIAAPNHPLTTHNPHGLVPYLEIDLYPINHLPDLSNFTSPRFFATHVPFSSLPSSVGSSRCKVVYICRNPKDTFVSLWHFYCKAGNLHEGALPIEKAFERFCKGDNYYGPFWDHVLGYWKASIQSPSEVLFLRYEEFKKEPMSCLKRLAGFLGCPFSSLEEESGVMAKLIELCGFESLSNMTVNKEANIKTGLVENRAYFRRGKVGDWVNHFTPEMNERLEKINEEKLHGTGLKF